MHLTLINLTELQGGRFLFFVILFVLCVCVWFPSALNLYVFLDSWTLKPCLCRLDNEGQVSTDSQTLFALYIMRSSNVIVFFKNEIIKCYCLVCWLQDVAGMPFVQLTF